MGRKVDTAWYGHYRWAQKQLTESAHSHSEIEAVHHEIAKELQLTTPTLRRILKSGRFLDSQIHIDNPEQVLCGYVQLEELEKLARIDPQLAKEKLPAVLNNQVRLRELVSMLEMLAEDRPEKFVSTTKNKSRKPLLAHENSSSVAIQRAGTSFFGAPDGQLIKAPAARRYYTYPNFLITVNEQPFAAIFIRLATSSRPYSKAASELVELCLAHKHFVEHVWLIFPEWSDITKFIAASLDDLKSYHPHARWLHLAIVDPDTQKLVELTHDEISVSIVESSFLAFHGISTLYYGTDVASGRKIPIKYFTPNWPNVDSSKV
ncbi:MULTISPECIES: hypothetical protein [Pseudomonas]|uniref:hypothetical protein n=1 Tax=Pseudomonas TaxID=286 RepID=UPI003002BD77